MRIGIDGLALQSPDSRGRGIGRYAGNLLRHLFDGNPNDEFVLYEYPGLPDIRELSGSNVRVETAPELRPLSRSVEALTSENPHDVELFLVTSPFERVFGYQPPAPPLNGLRMAAVVYDLIPLLYPERYLADGETNRWYAAVSATLKRYDSLLAISQATKSDIEKLYGVPSSRTVNISGAVDAGEFGEPVGAREAETRLARLGITKPFVFSLSGMDERKNYAGLIEAFSRLPVELRDAHQLVITCKMTEREVEAVRAIAVRHGVGSHVVLTNFVPDAALQALLSRCEVFVFPSVYEGFGLPILEAMRFGAAVVAGNNSSQVEVTGDAGLLVNVHNSADITQAIRRLIETPALRARLKTLAVARAREFTWEKVATTARRAIAAAGPAPSTSRRPKPRLALFSPLPPKQSGVADYAFVLAEQLAETYAVDLYHDAGYTPSTLLADGRFRCCDHRLFPRNNSLLRYDRILYQMGNSEYHGYIYDMLTRHPGVVTLHDFNLAGFHFWYGGTRGDAGWLTREHDHCHPGAALPSDVESCQRLGLNFNRRIFERAEHVIVHSLASRERGSALCGSDRVSLSPFGVTVPPGIPADEAVRRRADLGLPRDAVLIAAFGILHPTKMNRETVHAFAQVAQEVPAARLAFVGRELDGGETRRAAAELGLGDQIVFLGHQDLEAFHSVMEVTDIGVNLRRPPTNGETSASLFALLARGIPTVVTDVGSFSELPDQVALKVSPDERPEARLAAALLQLAQDARRRRQTGDAARRFVESRHSWRVVAADYVSILEEVAARRRDSAAA